MNVGIAPGEYLEFVWAAYGFAAAGIAGLVLFVLLERKTAYAHLMREEDAAD